jgi:hypothetical protein
MGAPKGNRFWEMRSKSGRRPSFSSPDDLYNSACEYFQWVEDNPLWEYKAAQYQGEPVELKVPKMRAMTLNGLCIFLDISQQTWYEYCGKDDYSEVTLKIKQIIDEQKFAGAAADLFNANIIARDLGLADKIQNSNSHSFDFSNIPDEELKRIASGDI